MTMYSLQNRSKLLSFRQGPNSAPPLNNKKIKSGYAPP